MGAGVEVTCVRGSSLVLFLWLFYVFLCEIKIFIENMAKFWANVYSHGPVPCSICGMGFFKEFIGRRARWCTLVTRQLGSRVLCVRYCGICSISGVGQLPRPNLSDPSNFWQFILNNA